MSDHTPIQIDRRTAFKWVLAAAAAMQMPESVAEEIAKVIAAKGYGKDPNLQKIYTPGEVWPLTFNPTERRTAAVLSDAILPADGEWPAASKLGTVEFIDEWISAPYSQMTEDRELIVEGLTWLDGESQRRFQKKFSELSQTQLGNICDQLAPSAEQSRRADRPARFFARFRQLVAAAYYTTPQGMRDIGYVGNVPLATYDGPPKEVLRKAGVIE